MLYCGDKDIISYKIYINFFLILFMASLVVGIVLIIVLKSCSIFIEFKLQILNRVGLEYLIYIDWVSASFMAVVLIISSMVIIYSLFYMHKVVYIKFIILILLFVVSMCLIILSPNILRIILGWDGLGLISYLLVIYYNNMKSMLSGIITVLRNRLGDAAIIFSLVFLLERGNLNIIFLDLRKDYRIYFFFVFIAGITKRAQIPFSVWLPAAIAAPTPISSLVHSSTLVTAGVYLFLRYSPIIRILMSHVIVVLASFTLFLSSFAAFFEGDFKKSLRCQL